MSKLIGFIRNNKWMCAFILTAVALVAAITVAICIGVGSGDDPAPAPEYIEGAENGVYYYDVVDGEILLTLAGGNTFTIAGPNINKTGTYTIDGEGNIVLDYLREGEENGTAKLAGNTLTLIEGNESKPFLKKVNYTVTFNVNGGSAVDSITVINGKTVTKPVDPTKDGYAFLGWYADSELKNVYNFASATVTENITLYAKWVNDQVGVGKHTISLDLGYAGSAYDNITTISGIAYGVPTPTRDGYTFGGWWISMYENGEKLSYEYTESTEFEADTTLYAIWIPNEGVAVPAPLVSVSNNSIKWNAVAGASYNVTITDANGNVVLNETNVGTTSIAYDFGAQAAGEYTVSVVAVTAAGNSDATVRYYANKTLSMVSQFQVIDGILIFSPVKNATSYLITVDCGNSAHQHTDVNIGAALSYSLINCPMQDGGIKITVTAQAEGYASSVSKTFVYNKVLNSIDSVVYNAQTDSFVWNAVPGASTYVVTVKIGDKTYTVNNGPATSFSVAAYTGEIEVSVVPSTNGYNSPAPTKATCTKVTPAMPTGVTVNGMVISWNAAEGAQKYEVKIGDTVKEVTETSYTIPENSLIAGKTYAISVKAINGAESSAYTTPVTYGYLVMVPTVTYSGNTVYWTPVIGATKYEIRVNGTVVANVENVSSAKVALTAEGVNTIEVRCVDVAGSTWNKVEVVAYSINYYPRNGGGVITQYYAFGDTITTPRDMVYEGYDFVDWYSSPNGAAGNGKLYAEGSVFNEYNSIAVFGDWTPKTYKITVSIDASYGVSNITDKSEFFATYTKDFTIGVPLNADAESLIFAGWYTQPGGAGTQLTDEEGNSVAPYGLTRDTVAYPYFRAVLAYVLQPDDTYGVKAGPGFDSAKNVTVPVEYEGIKVSVILENAFANKRNVVRVNIPDTVKLVGVGAFSGCTALEYIDVYDAGSVEKIYFSDNGALVKRDVDTVSLEAVPRNMTGTYEMHEDIQYIASRAFMSSQLDKVIIGKNVTNIAKYAFYICSHIQIFEFAEGREQAVTIENEAFHQCNGVTEFTLPKEFTTVDNTITQFLDHFKKLKTIKTQDGCNYKAIENNTLLANTTGTELIYAPIALEGEFTVPVGISTVSDKVLINRTLITRIIIPRYVTSIGAQAFAGCTGVRTVDFSGNRMSDLAIGAQAFAGLTSLTTVTFKANTNEDAGSITIGERAFIPGTSTVLTNLVFEDGVKVTSIGTAAFANQSKLNPFTVGEGTVVAAIGASAFINNAAIIHLTIPACVTSIASNAYANCDNLSDVTFEDSENTVSLAENAFQNCQNLRKITLSAQVRGFNGGVVTGCLALREIVVNGNNPEIYIENGILYNSAKTNLMFYPKALIIEKNGVIDNLLDGITTIDASVFQANTDIVSINLPASLTTIGNYAFTGCTALKNVNFALSTDATAALTLGTYAFQDCTKLVYGTEGIVLPAYTTNIGNYAFDGCTGIVGEITLPTGLTNLGNYAFSGCTGITAITLPEALTTIGTGAFKGVGITTITIPAAVTTINAGAFQNCTALTTVTVATGTTNLSIGSASDTASSTSGAFEGCTSLATVNLGNRVTVIGNSTFKGCSALTSIDLGNKVTNIGNSAFKGAGLTSITIPATVANIYSNAFDGDTAGGALTEINFVLGNTATNLTIKSNVFANQPNVTALVLPARTKTIYTKTAGSTSKIETYVVGIAGLTNLVDLQVESISGHSATFCTIDGVLYENKNGVPTNLVWSPAKNPGNNGTVTVPKTVTYVFSEAFANVTAITTVNFEEYDVSDTANYGKPTLQIGYYTSAYSSAKAADAAKAVFGGNAANSITEINFPSHLKSLGSYAVGVTAGNVEVNFSTGSTAINVAPYAFYKATFEAISIPNVAAIGKGAFSNCADATSIGFTTAATISTIPQYLFENCVSLTSYTIPASITTIDSYAFQGCTGLTGVTFETGSKLSKINSNVFKNSGLASIDLSGCSSLASIGTSAFELCTSLTSVNLTGLTKLTSINNYAFRYCTALESFTLPTSVTTFSTDVLAGCTALEEVTLGKNFTPAMFKNNKFVGCTNLATINFVDNTNFVTDSFGAVYDPEYTTIYRFPEGADATNYVVPSTVNTITEYAFAFYSGTSLILPEGLETIGDYAFYANNFTTLVIPSTVTSIGKYSMSIDNSRVMEDGKTKYLEVYESKLTTVIFSGESKLTTIGEYAFYYASALTNIDLPDSVTTLGRAAFYQCSSLPSIVIPAGVSLIDRDAFYGCTSLKSVTLQEGLTQIGSTAFAFPTKTEVAEEDLGSLTIAVPSTVTAIGGQTFDCNLLFGGMTFTANSKLTSIGNAVAKSTTGAGTDYTFRGTMLKEIVLPPLLSSVEAGIFFTPNTNTYVGYTDVLESVTFTGTALAALPNNFFISNANLKSVVLPEGLVSIGTSAFSSSNVSYDFEPKTQFTSITLPASVTTIGNLAFANCLGLEEVIFAEGSQITEIPANLFKGAVNLEDVVLPEALEVIGANAFENTAITTLVLPETVTTIGEGAFRNCDNIVRMDLSNVQSIGAYAFYDCDSLVSATTDTGLTYIGALAFASCEELTTAYIPYTVYDMGGNPYAGCTKVTVEIDPMNEFYAYDANGILFDKEMTVLIAYPASATDSVLVIPDGVNTIAPGAFACGQFETVVFPARFGTIPDNAFYGCTNLKSIVIQDGISEIGNAAFQGCTSLNNVEIPNSVSYVGNYAFAGCTSLSDASFQDKADGEYYTLGTHIFDGCLSLTEVVLPNAWRITTEDAAANNIDSGDRMNPGPLVSQLEGNIPSYMFANTGIVDAVLPARANQLATAGVFMNCTNLRSVTFGVTQLATTAAQMGADYFAGCTSLPADFTPPHKTGNVSGGGGIGKL